MARAYGPAETLRRLETRCLPSGDLWPSGYWFRLLRCPVHFRTVNLKQPDNLPQRFS